MEPDDPAPEEKANGQSTGADRSADSLSHPKTHHVELEATIGQKLDVTESVEKVVNVTNPLDTSQPAAEPGNFGWFQPSAEALRHPASRAPLTDPTDGWVPSPPPAVSNASVADEQSLQVVPGLQGGTAPKSEAGQIGGASGGFSAGFDSGGFDSARFDSARFDAAGFDDGYDSNLAIDREIPDEAAPETGTAPDGVASLEATSLAIPEPVIEAPDLDAIPPQVQTGSQFTLDAEGRIDLAADPPASDSLQREMYRELRHKALDALALGHNQLADLAQHISRFLAAAPERIEDVSVTVLWSRGNSLRRRLKAHEIAFASSDNTDPALLPALVAEALRDLVDTYNVFIVGDPRGRELDQVRLGPQERQQADAAVNVAFLIVEAVKASNRLATTAAVDALAEQIDAARKAPAGMGRWRSRRFAAREAGIGPFGNDSPRVNPSL